jgi:hypothetical protein
MAPADDGEAPAAPPSLKELTEGPYFVLAAKMDEYDLCQTDVTCKLLHKLNCTLGPWRALGARAFRGMELEREGTFEFDKEREEMRDSPDEKLVRIDWKSRYRHFKTEIPKFRSPFEGTEITEVQNPDEVAYCKCKLRTDLLDRRDPMTDLSLSSSCYSDRGVYLEVEVSSNADNLSLAVVDFDEGGKSSVTFSPDTGAVIKEKKIQESPRRVKGAYIQPLQPKLDRFEGKMGLYVRNSHIAFFRRYKRKDSDPEEQPWESTGFVIDLSWAEGRRLTPCLAFRDEGSYRVRVVRVDSCPPLWPEKMPGAYEEKNWSELNWEGGQPIQPEI